MCKFEQFILNQVEDGEMYLNELIHSSEQQPHEQSEQPTLSSRAYNKSHLMQSLKSYVVQQTTTIHDKTPPVIEELNVEAPKSIQNP